MKTVEKFILDLEKTYDTMTKYAGEMKAGHMESGTTEILVVIQISILWVSI